MNKEDELRKLAIEIRDISTDLYIYTKTLNETNESSESDYLEKRYNDLHEIAEKIDVTVSNTHQSEGKS